MRKTLLTLLFVVMSLVMINADDFKRPDFAYPASVVKDASSLIEKGQRSQNYPLLIRGLINYQVAQSAIDRDSTVKSLNLIESVRNDTRSDVPKALIDVLMAKIYASIYQSNKWNYDSHQLPDGSISADYTLWDGKMFRKKIMGLLQNALSAKSELEVLPLDTYKDIIDITDASKPFFPTMYDFVAGQAIDMMRTFVKNDSYFPLEYICGFDKFRNLSFSYQPEVKRRILDLYKELLEYHDGDIAPMMYWNIQRLKFTNEFMYSGDQHEIVNAKFRDAFFDLYSSNKSSEYSCEALLGLEYYANDDIDRYYSECLKDAIKRFPSYARINCVKNVLNRINNPQIEITYNSTVVPGDSLTININNKNTGSFDIYVYKVPYTWESANSFNFKRDRSRAQLVRTLHVTSSEVKPFKIVQKESLVLNSPGCYILVPSLKGKPSVGHYQLLHCTDTYISTGSYGNDKWAYLTNPLTGRPLDAGVSVIVTRHNGTKVASYKTDNNGTAVLGEKGDMIFTENGGDRYAQYAYMPGSYIPDSTLRYIAHLVTDLAVYHPGDTVRWSAVMQSYRFKEAYVVDRMKVKVTLLDANNQEKDSSVCVSDDYGRVYGSFLLPKDGLTGNYSIKVEAAAVNSPRRTLYGRCNFMVSDYKLPTYEVLFTQILRNEPEKDAVTLKGKVVTYSGFPLAHCEGSFALSAYPKRWGRYMGNGVTFYTDSLVSDADGKFEITLPAQLLAQAPIVNGDYSVLINFVSSAGESQSADMSFSLGKPYVINVNLKKNLEASGVMLPDVVLTDPMGDKVDVPMLCKVINNGTDNVVKTLKFQSSNPKMELTGIPSGLYNFEFVTADSALADSVVVESVYVYHKDDTMLYGLESDLWIPNTDFLVNGNEDSDILIGTVNSEIWVHYTITGDNRFISQGWKKFERGVNHWNYNLPEGVDKVKIQLFTVVNYNTISSELNITDRNSLKKIVVGVENFRDKIVPGTKETWTFTLKDINGHNSSGALMLDMYCKALDRLASHPFSMSPRFGGSKFFRWGSYGMKDAANDYISGDFRYLDCVNLNIPQYQLWGEILYDSGIRIRGMAMMKSAADAGNGIMVEEESADGVFYAVEDKAVYNSMATPTLTGGVTDDSEVVEEAEDESASQQEESSRFSYREAETPLAFFMPDLTFADGKSSITFEVPNANTTWRLQAIAFTKDLQVSTLGLDAVASKPVMVQPNLPRFIRQGDKVELLAEVMNNSDSTAYVDTRVEIFDPLTQEVIQIVDSTVVVEQGRSAIVPAVFDCVRDYQLIGYRVRANSGIYSDGEQSVIPVLPSVSDVIDTYPFYIPKDSTHFEMKLPKIDKNSTVTLQYCNNPAWYLVTAIPGLVPDNQGTSLSAVASLYSALTAENILSKNPSIVSALKYWSENNDNDSVLVSMLEKNADLKTILLNSTPWVSQAKRETQRMSDLVLLLDNANIREVYDKAVKKLSILQCSDGGWAWIEQSRYSSQWVTMKVLNLIGQLKQQDCLGHDSRLEGIIDRALRYLDNCMAKRMAHDPKAVDCEYVYVRGMYDMPVSGSAKSLKLNTLNYIRHNWKNFSIFSKAQGGIVMMRDNYKGIAKDMLESIRQYAISNPYKGMWWQEINDAYPSVSKYAVTAMVLDFMHMVDPASADIEKIAQWLVLQKETTDWGDSYMSSQVVSSLFNNGWCIVSNESLPVITIDKKPIKISSTDALIGNVDEDISGMKLSGKTLAITGSGDASSWGAIFVKSEQVMGTIAQHSCQDLSITKTIYKKVNDEGKVEWVDSDTFNVGDEVQVNLTLKVNRNLDYVAIIDERAACFEPVEQLPAPMIQDGIYFYRENRDAATNIFVDRLPKGTYRLSYNLKVNNAGEFSSGIASAQSQYAPAVSAHSAGESIKILPM